MGTHMSNGYCPNCGSDEMLVIEDTRPIYRTYAECYECGFQMYPEYSQMLLEELNDFRVEYNDDNGLIETDEDFKHPLTELPPFNSDF